MKSLPLLFFLLDLLLLPACGSSASSILPTPLPPRVSASPAPTVAPGLLPAPTRTLSIPSATACEDWQSLPVIPAAGERMRALYRRGQTGGNDPHAFSKIGDGEISAEWFFTAFDLGGAYYDLGQYEDLTPALAYFSGSFGRTGAAAKRGFNTDRILDPAFREPADCTADESPLTCELRLHRPAFAILSLGTNQAWQPEEFEAGLREILDILVSRNVIPILSTKGDNLEGDHRINTIVACLAREYDVPLWNFWAAIQPLPDHGLQPDREHLTYGIPDFGDEHAMQSAWTVRNLTALQALDAVWRGVTAER